ncbi:dynein light chain type 1-domain-containing protein [Pavlovales sp. CCMP2436]|nr:dynein light chain type 1-domain-containing protein [Pavlovales sp. CCMP2436]
MSEDMQQDAVDCAQQALKNFNHDGHFTAYIKNEFDEKYDPTWHCIVGRSFGASAASETKHVIYFYIGEMTVLLFKYH